MIHFLSHPPYFENIAEHIAQRIRSFLFGAHIIHKLSCFFSPKFLPLLVKSQKNSKKTSKNNPSLTKTSSPIVLFSWFQWFNHLKTKNKSIFLCVGVMLARGLHLKCSAVHALARGLHWNPSYARFGHARGPLFCFFKGHLIPILLAENLHVFFFFRGGFTSPSSPKCQKKKTFQ